MSALPTVLDVSYRWCNAERGNRCTRIPSGDIAPQPHSRRFIELSAAMSNGTEFIVKMLHDDDHIGVKAGEEYAAIRYWLDPSSKVTLLRRISDGWNPECNQYLHAVDFVGWVGD
ncbi:MAG: hypothetical protein HLX51_00905 [Micrococcaceae bacterium]|nr:hypothetical protein [Micrococcaceae bacterium]